MPPSRARTPPPRAWRHGLFDCGDAALCCAVAFCQCNAAGQMYQRTTGGGCLGVSALMWFLFVLTQTLGSSSNALARAYERDDGLATANAVVGALAGVFGLVTTIAGTYFLCVSRRALRARDRIPPGACGDLDDCCVSYWCGCCSLVQMLRQEGVTGAQYRACTATAV